MNSVDKILRGIEDWVNVVTFVIMLTLTFVNVFSRFVLHASLAFTDEFVTVLFVLCSLAGSSVGQRNRNHLGLDFFTGFLPETAQRFISFCANILALIFLAILFYALGVRLIGPGNAALVNTMEPVLACIFGHFLVGDVLTTVMLIGSALVVLAVLITNLPEKRERT